MRTEQKLHKLCRIIQDAGSAVLAFSGGVDSVFLGSIARRILGPRVLAVTVATQLGSDAQMRQAMLAARRIKIKHLLSRLTLGDQVMRNSPRRCYLCKKEIFSYLVGLARRRHYRWVIEGSHVNDRGDFRPGLRALRELGVRSPLDEVGLTKVEIRRLSRQMGIGDWDRPSDPCLASRIAYGEPVTPAKVKRIARAEAFLRKLGFPAVRLRVHGPLVRIEVPGDKVKSLLAHRQAVVKKIRSLGFIYVCADLAGFRSGSMNEVLRWKKRK